MMDPFQYFDQMLATEYIALQGFKKEDHNPVCPPKVKLSILSKTTEMDTDETGISC